jgi:hypothetical protein
MWATGGIRIGEKRLHLLAEQDRGDAKTNIPHAERNDEGGDLQTRVHQSRRQSEPRAERNGDDDRAKSPVRARPAVRREKDIGETRGAHDPFHRKVDSAHQHDERGAHADDRRDGGGVQNRV